MVVKITRLEGDKFKAESNGYEVFSGRIDEQSPPVGMSPGKLMVASLGLCSAFHAAWYFKRHNIEAKNFSIKVDEMNEKSPSRASEFTIEVDVGAKLNASHIEGLLAEIKRCYVGNTMKGNPKFNYQIKAES